MSAALGVQTGPGGGPTVDEDDVVNVTVVHDELTFDSRQALRLKEIERKLIEDTKRKKRDWERDVEKMREEFLVLHPVDDSSRSNTITTAILSRTHRGRTAVALTAWCPSGAVAPRSSMVRR